MWEGPSWISSVESTGDSPPTKWPRVTTPPNRRDSLISADLDDSGLGASFCSPPLSARANVRVSPLRTPSSRTSAMSNSPYSRFRLSSFSSPTYSDRALRLSNCDNVIDIKFCEERLEKNHGRVDIARLGTSNAARSLEMPSTSKIEDPLPEPDIPIPGCSLFGTIETPSKCFPLFNEDPGDFNNAFGDLSGVSPLKPLIFDDSRPSTSMNSSQVSSQPSVDSSAEASSTENEADVERPPVIMSNNISSTFVSPKKPLKMFSRRWTRIVFGSTTAQRQMTEAAKAFMAERTAVKTLNQQQQQQVPPLQHQHLFSSGW